MITRRRIRINALRMILSLMFLLPSALIFGQRGLPPTMPAKPGGGPALCKLESLPQDVQRSLKEEFESWKVQEPSDLSAQARERWKSEKPLECPGIAVGQFESGQTPSCAVLLVPRGHSDAGYKLIVFGPKTGQPSSELMVIEQSEDSGAANFFIHRVRINKFFGEQSRKKFHVQANDGILLADAEEKQYETDVYFWANGSYQHQPVDY